MDRSKRWSSVVAGLLFASLAGVSGPAAAFGATYCINCETSAQGTVLTGTLQSILASINTETTTLTEFLTKNTQAIVSQLGTNLAGEGKIASAQDISIRKSLKQQTAALIAHQTQETYGYGSKSFTVDGVTHRPTGEPLTLCGSSARAAAAGAAITAQQKNQQTVTQTLADYNNAPSSQKQATARYQSMPKADHNPQWVLGESGLTAKNAKAGTQWIETMTNPVPAPKLSPKRQKTIAGKAYHRQRTILNDHLRVAQYALSTVKGDNQPTVKLKNQIKNRWAQINPNEPIPSSNGKVSPLTVLRTEINYRYASKQWTDRLVDMSQHAQMVSLLTMKAIGLHLALKRYELARENTAMRAISLSDNVRHQMKHLVKHQHSIAVDTNVGNGQSSTQSSTQGQQPGRS